MSVQRNCPRELFLRKKFKLGEDKYKAIYTIMDTIVSQIETDSNIDQMVADEFAKIPQSCMLTFEARSEESQMKLLFKRLQNYMADRLGGKIIARSFSFSIEIAGQTEIGYVHWLVERDNELEAIRFKYKAPEYSYRARSDASKPEKSPELLKIQRTGEKMAQELGIQKPVSGAIYYLKHKRDTSKSMESEFEDKRGMNIIAHYFVPSEIQNIEMNYTSLKPDPKTVCSEEDCNDCKYYDLCHTDFKKRSLMENQNERPKSYGDIDLTSAQQRFVYFENGECRVNAVAGSGKTTIVALRTLRLLWKGCPPEKILMVTFSEKAKEEMALRMKTFAEGTVDVEKIQIETFNSWGQKLLDQYYPMLGFTAMPKLIDEVTKKDIVIKLLEKHQTLPLDYRNPFLSVGAAEGAVVRMTKLLDTMKSAHIETEEHLTELLKSDKTMENQTAELLKFYQEYNETLLKINAIDYEDQLRLMLKLADFGIFEKLPYEHIVIDEFQDSNPNQIEIIMKLKYLNPHIQSLVVVGDELQAIYGFRNATPDNLVEFSKYFPNMVDIDMTENFRSQEPIIEMANHIIEKTAKLGKIIEAHKKDMNVQPVVCEIEEESMEIALYVRQVKKLIQDGVYPGDIAILCRTRAELKKLQKAMEEENIPVILKVPEIISDSPFVKSTIAFASYLLDPEDRYSLALYVKSTGADPFDADVLEKSAEAIQKTFADCATDLDKINAFFEFLKDASEDYIGQSFLEHIRSMNFSTFEEYLNYCVKYSKYNVKDTQNTSMEKTDCVTLITVHSAKGLEWDTVLLSLKKFPIDEESQRLFYVGITRAKERLLVTYTKKQTLLANLLK